MVHSKWMAMALALALSSGAISAAEDWNHPNKKVRQNTATPDDEHVGKPDTRKEVCRVGPYRPPFDLHFYTQCLRRQQQAHVLNDAQAR